MNLIRKATIQDACRISEIEIFNYRLSFYPIFHNDIFYFDELRVDAFLKKYQEQPQLLENTYVFDDGVVKGFLRMNGTCIEKLFVEPVLQGLGIGEKLLHYAIHHLSACSLWALEKNTRAIAFYQRHGFQPSGERKAEDDTAEFLIQLVR